MQNILECCICYSQYNHRDRAPKEIPTCHHTICLKCLDGIINVQRSLKCPLDRIPFPPEHQNPQLFKVNIEILDKLEEALAGVCEKHQKQNTMVCFLEKTKICEDCIGKKEAHENHKVLSIKEVRRISEEKIERLQAQISRFEGYKVQHNKDIDEKKLEALKEAQMVSENIKEAIAMKSRESTFEIASHLAMKKLLQKVVPSSNTQPSQESQISKSVNQTIQKDLTTLISSINQTTQDLENSSLGIPTNIYDENRDLKSRVIILQQMFLCQIHPYFDDGQYGLCILFGDNQIDTSFLHHSISLQNFQTIKGIVFKASDSNGSLISQEQLSGTFTQLWTLLNIPQISQGIESIQFDFSRLESLSLTTNWSLLLSQKLFNFSNLKVFNANLSSKHLMDTSLDHFSSKILPNLTRLEEFQLNLRDTKITDQSLKSLFYSLRDCVKNLRIFSLILWDTAITDDSIVAFCEYTLPNMTSIKKLTLGLEDVKAESGMLTDKSVGPLFTGLKDIGKYLEYLEIGLSQSEVSDGVFDLFVNETFPVMVNLEEITLGLVNTKINVEKIDSFRESVTISNYIYGRNEEQG